MAKGYWIARVDVRDAERYKDYVSTAKAAFERYGANFLVRGGAVTELEGKARDFYMQTRPQLAGMQFDALVQQLSDSPPSEKAAPPRRLDETATRQLLAGLNASYGSYEGIQPVDLARSAMPAPQLIDELIRLRERSLLRVSGEALADIDTTNTLINTLRYRRN